MTDSTETPARPAEPPNVHHLYCSDQEVRMLYALLMMFIAGTIHRNVQEMLDVGLVLHKEYDDLTISGFKALVDRMQMHYDIVTGPGNPGTPT